MASFIITFRETIEAALIIGIILGYLSRTGMNQYRKFVYSGTIAGVFASLAGAFLFNLMAGGFHGRAEEIFEGITMIAGSFLLSTMILWMMKQKNRGKDIEGKIESSINSSSMNQGTGIFLIVFISILREGIETVLFLESVSISSSGSTLMPAVSGILLAAVAGYLFFAGSLKIDMKKFFNLTGVMLLLFAAGLLAHGIHELQEAGIVPVIIEHLFDINPALHADGSYPLLHEKGLVGSFFKGLFGYNGNPSLIEVISYLGYMTASLAIWFKFGNNTEKKLTPVENI